MESKAHMHLGHSSLRASPIHSIQHFAKKPRSPNFGKPIPNRFTKTKFWETDTEPFFWDQILGNQYRTVFLKSNLRKPIPNRFSNTKFFKTETGTHKKWQKSQKQEVSKPKCHSLHLTFCNQDKQCNVGVQPDTKYRWKDFEVYWHHTPGSPVRRASKLQIKKRSPIRRVFRALWLFFWYHSCR